MFYKSLGIVFLLCFVHGTQSKPSANNELTEGRGIGSTIWGWITYPFTWWSYREPEPPTNDQLVGSTTYGPQDVKEIGKHNVTIWCNDQTCTTMRCDIVGCRNITCNIYDTDLNGECREYNTLKPEETPIPPVTPKSFDNKVTEATKVTNLTISFTPTQVENSPSNEERPLELEAALSSTIQASSEIPADISDVERPHNKI